MCADEISENAMNQKSCNIETEVSSAPFFIVFLIPLFMANTPFIESLGQGAASAGVTSASTGLVGQFFGGWNARRQWRYQKKQMELQQKYALEQMDRQFALQRQQFDYENEYNSPVNLFARFRQAGVNPAAVLGGSGASLSATMPMPAAPVGGHVSGGPVIGSGAPIDGSSALAASQIRLNNAAAENQQSSANLSDEKSATESSVRNMLAATVDEKVQNAYFTKQRGIYQGLVNAKTRDMIDAQITELRSHADQLIASARLSEEQVSLVKEQVANTFFDSQLKQAMMATQGELARLYASETGFVSLQADDLRRNIESLKASNKYETIQYIDGEPRRVVYTVDAYQAKALSMKFAAMAGCADAAVSSVAADWADTNQWTQTISAYWRNVNGTIGSIGHLMVGARGAQSSTITQTSHSGPNGEFLGGSVTSRIPYRR